MKLPQSIKKSAHIGFSIAVAVYVGASVQHVFSAIATSPQGLTTSEEFVKAAGEFLRVVGTWTALIACAGGIGLIAGALYGILAPRVTTWFRQE